MEDILASIRRIIAADHPGSLGRGGLAALAPKPAASEMEEIDAEPVAKAPPVRPALISDALLTGAIEAELAVEQPIEAPIVHEAEAASDDLRDLEELNAELANTSVHGDVVPPAAEPIEETHEAVYDLQLQDLVAQASPEPLISPSIGESISSSFHALAESFLFENPDKLERMARDAMRPLLKSWLDENLPSMVERLVRAEIERVARGGRSRS